MFLATTGLREFWDTSDEMLFLGPWCLRPGVVTDLERSTVRVLESPWDDRARYFEAARYIDECQERMIGRLADYLNATHGVSLSRRYWRILIGPWLMYYVHSVYDRYIHLSEALERYPQLRTIVLDPRDYRVPRNAFEASAVARDDAYNLQIFSLLFNGLGRCFPTRRLVRTSSKGGQDTWKRGLARRVARAGIRTLMDGFRRVGGRRVRIALCEMYSSRAALWALAWKTRFRAVPLEMNDQWPFPLPTAVLDERRQALATLPSVDEFERLAWQTFPYAFPSLYLEGYQAARAASDRIVDGAPPVIVSSTGWYFNEPFKNFAAAAAELRGSRLVALQHGGSYGIARSCPPERHESRIADSYMVWGWADETREPSYQNVPSPRLSSRYSRMRSKGSRQNDTVLYVGTEGSPYLYRFDSTPVTGQWQEYRDWSVRFLDRLSARVRTKLVFRPYPVDYGWRIRESVVERFPEVRFDRLHILARSAAERRLLVIDYRETAFLETLAANLPTVLFWDPDRWELREEVGGLFEALREVGILWDSPESAASHVDSVYDDPTRWWNSQAVQQARQSFVERLALTRDDWTAWWSRALEREMQSVAKAPRLL